MRWGPTSKRREVPGAISSMWQRRTATDSRAGVDMRFSSAGPGPGRPAGGFVGE